MRFGDRYTGEPDSGGRRPAFPWTSALGLPERA
ncbi:hypothetical protein SGPA1_41269 [Streptomyces misionensis JCM 4497]